jgi:hypothetical protein
MMGYIRDRVPVWVRVATVWFVVTVAMVMGFFIEIGKALWAAANDFRCEYAALLRDGQRLIDDLVEQAVAERETKK